MSKLVAKYKGCNIYRTKEGLYRGILPSIPYKRGHYGVCQDMPTISSAKKFLDDVMKQRPSWERNP